MFFRYLVLSHQLYDCDWCRFIAICLLSNDINDYHIVAQGKTVIPGVDDGEEMNLTDVSPDYDYWLSFHSFYLSLTL